MADLSKKIEAYWHARGFAHVKAWTEVVSQKLGARTVSYTATKSNLIAGSPPPEPAGDAKK